MLQVDVTAEDIKNGIPRDPKSCPIALALQRTFNTTNATWGSTIGIINDVVYTATAEDESATENFVDRFDKRFVQDAKVEPFSFNLESWSANHKGYWS